MASLNPPDTSVALSKVSRKTLLASPNLSYTLGVSNRILAEKPLTSQNISKPLVPPSSVSEPPIDPSRILGMLPVPLIYSSITTESDPEPQCATPQVRHKYKISLGHEAAIDFSSWIALNVIYSSLFASFLGSSFRSLSKNKDKALASNLNIPPISGPIKSIAVKIKNAQKKPD